MPTDTAVIIGRWQPVHRGHVQLLHQALNAAPKVVVVIGSAWHSRDSRHPFTWQERQQQFESALTPAERARVSFVPVRDYSDDDRWSSAVRNEVAKVAAGEWITIEPQSENDIDSAQLLDLYFESPGTMGDQVGQGVKAFLETWSHTPAYQRCAAEYKAVAAYKKKYTQPFSLTADSVVTVSGHVLLIKRGGTIGNGLWALPGGFIDPHERFYTAAVRELEEETRLTAPPAQMKAALRGQAVFDEPWRSARGRIVTEAFHFDFGDGPLPKVQGADDAKEARWVPITELAAMEELLFEDHAVILNHFLALWP
jgi:bifunctional NMN adenylyltransferase/nudix hydrolase